MVTIRVVPAMILLLTYICFQRISASPFITVKTIYSNLLYKLLCEYSCIWLVFCFFFQNNMLLLLSEIHTEQLDMSNTSESEESSEEMLMVCLGNWVFSRAVMVFAITRWDIMHSGSRKWEKMEILTNLWEKLSVWSETLQCIYCTSRSK